MREMIFKRARRVRFADVDPAGIVFYPRYFEMINEIVEDWFDQALHLNFGKMTVQEGRGVPVVHIETDFLSPSRLYEELEFSLNVEHIGRSSAALSISAHQDGDYRLRARIVIVHLKLASHTAEPWPEELANRIEGFIQQSSQIIHAQ